MAPPSGLGTLIFSLIFDGVSIPIIPGPLLLLELFLCGVLYPLVFLCGRVPHLLGGEVRPLLRLGLHPCLCLFLFADLGVLLFICTPAVLRLARVFASGLLVICRTSCQMCSTSVPTFAIYVLTCHDPPLILTNKCAVYLI